MGSDAVKTVTLLLQSLRFFFTDQQIKDDERNRNFCLSFLEELQKKYNLKQIGEDWLWQYLVYHHKRNMETSMKNARYFSVSWIYGKKALNAYFTRNKEMEWTLSNYAQLFDKKKFYQIFPTAELRKVKKSNSNGYNVQEVYRKTRLNQDDGFEYCLTFTTLYDEKSESCKVCKFKQECEIDRNVYYRPNGETRTTSFKNKVIKSVHS